ncbi:L-rhamnose mutarotase [Conchiformibius kuhniae]|uniref:L-rhamnose mutarotase n=1 Tax=Conchiformibius kuhniae TaxID=211502 RepID=A0A8T9MU98_9NEIS|nr:L-rhamnose mutarotase [Conchiformibius kuhniae]
MQYALMLDLQDDEQKIAEYEAHHRAVWPQVLAHIRANGVRQMRIYRLGTRMVMLMDTDDTFSFERMAQSAAQNEAVQRWETLMWQYQQVTPWTDAGAKWQPMREVFCLESDI